MLSLSETICNVTVIVFLSKFLCTLPRTHFSEKLRKGQTDNTCGKSTLP